MSEKVYHRTRAHTVQAIHNITFTNLHEFVQTFSKFYQKLRILCTKFTHEFTYEFVHETKKKKKFVCEISEIRAQILNEERNLCTDLNKPTRLHQDRHSKTSSFDN